MNPVLAGSGAVLIFGACIVAATVLLHLADDGVCRHCRHAQALHHHLRRGTDCAAKHCVCPRYRTREVRHILADWAAARLDVALGWAADLAAAVIGASEQPRCTACGGAKTANRVDHCLDCIITGRTTR